MPAGDNHNDDNGNYNNNNNWSRPSSSHIPRPSANKTPPPPDPSHLARPPRDRPARPTTPLRSALAIAPARHRTEDSTATAQHRLDRHEVGPWPPCQRPPTAPNEMPPRRFSTSSQTRPGSPGGPSSRPSQLTFLRPARLARSPGPLAPCWPLLSLPPPLLISPLSLIHRPWPNRRLSQARKTYTHPLDTLLRLLLFMSCLLSLLTPPAGAVVIGTGGLVCPTIPSYCGHKPGPLLQRPR